jgi:hypothetical protein
MPSTNRARVKNRRNSGSFLRLPHDLFRASGGRPPPCTALSKQGRLLLVDIAMQFNGQNNGNLSAAPAIMRLYGWNSNGTITRGLEELCALGFLELTRQGGRNRASLYALTWVGIDAGPHDAAPNPQPSALWRAENAHLRDPHWVRRWARRNANASPLEVKPCPLEVKSMHDRAA